MTSPNTALISIRDQLPGDRAFILATILRGLYYGDYFYSDIPKNVFMEHYHKILEGALNNPAIKIQVACLTDDPEVILGYSVFRPPGEKVIMDFVFVKKAWRRIGIAKKLVPQNLQVVTHLTKLGKALMPANVIYNPFI